MLYIVCFAVYALRLCVRHEPVARRICWRQQPSVPIVLHAEVYDGDVGSCTVQHSLHLHAHLVVLPRHQIKRTIAIPYMTVQQPSLV